MSTSDAAFMPVSSKPALPPPAPLYPRPFKPGATGLAQCRKCRKHWQIQRVLVDVRVRADGAGDEYELVLRCPQGCVTHISYATPALEADALRISTLPHKARRHAAQQHRQKFEALQMRVAALNIAFVDRPKGPPSPAPQVKPQAQAEAPQAVPNG